MLKCIRRCITGMIIISMFAVSVISCGDKENVQTADRSRYSKSVLGLACAETGLFLFEDGLVNFVSAESGEKSVFCFDPACEHTPASYSNPDPECMAAGYHEGSNTIAYHEGYIYFFVKYAFEHEVYRMDISAGTRELVAEIPVSIAPTNHVFEGDYAYYVASLGEQREDDPTKIDRYYELMELNLKDGSYRILTDMDKEKGYSFTEYDVCDGIMICRGAYELGFDLYCVKLDTLETELIIPAADRQQNAYMGLHNSESFYYVDYEAGDIGLYNINTGDKKVLVGNLNTDGKMISSAKGGNGKIYYKVRVGEEEVYEHFLYDMAEDKTWDITERCNELGVYNYNPYKSMFLRYEFGEDGKSIEEFLATSEAEVLGE